MHYQWIISVCLAAICAAAPGCKRSSHPETIPVKGTVTLDGKAVEGAAVAFYPKSGGNPAMGRTDRNGNYALSTYGDKDGAVPGGHSVVISKVARRASAKAPVASGDQQFAPPTSPEAEKAATEFLIPEKYSIAAESGLAAEVKRGCGPITFNLKSN